MPAAEGSFLGLAKQTAVGTPNETDAEFLYLLFNEGNVAPNTMFLPLDREVGGGALQRSIVKVGVASGGALRLIPRPETLGFFFYGATGAVSSATFRAWQGDLSGTTQEITTGITQPLGPSKVSIIGDAAGMTGNVVITGTLRGAAQVETLALDGITRVLGTKEFSTITKIDLPVENAPGDTVTVDFASGSLYKHDFKLGSDQFDAPYFTLRGAPANLWGEQMQDARVVMAALEWRGANFVRAGVSFLGGLPSKISTAAWDALNQVDSGPQFIAPYGAIELPVGTDAKVLAGSLIALSEIPLDEQYIVGKFTPDGLDITQRSFILNMTLKVTDDVLYTKMSFDPAGGNAWAADIFKEANIKLQFGSDADGYGFGVVANGQSGDAANVMWTVDPIALRAGRQVLMNVSAQFLATAHANGPITLSVTNSRSAY